MILELSSKEVVKINEKVGIQFKTEPIFRIYEHFEDGQAPQHCQFYNSWCGNKDICLEIESHLFKQLSKQRGGKEVSEIPSIDYTVHQAMKRESQFSSVATKASSISDFMKRSTCHHHRNKKIMVAYPSSAQWCKLYVVIVQRTSTWFSKQPLHQEG